MSDTVISVENLSKSYLIGHDGPQESYQSLRDTVVRHGKNYARKAMDMARGKQIIQGDSVEEFWALKDVSFEVKQGEVLGIIGRNGAGKSTLLKVLSRITEPTSGRVVLNGRVASLLEVGTGFHPELTGRENIFLNGAILGMNRAEIKQKFDEIVDFAGVEKFLDTPVKRYSSGMYVRLAFAVAAHLEPEILVVDEVLAVGDAEFQSKCLGKMKDVAGQGRTVLLVSHNMGSLMSLCHTAINLRNGSVFDLGGCSQVISKYLSEGAPSSQTFEISQVNVENRLRREDSAISKVHFVTEIKHTETVKGYVEIWIPHPINEMAVGIGFSNLNGTRLLSYDTDLFTETRFSGDSKGLYRFEFLINDFPLSPDTYSVDVGFRKSGFTELDYVGQIGRIDVKPGHATPGFIVNRHPTARLASQWKMTFDSKISSQ